MKLPEPPKTFDEAVKILVAGLNDKEREHIKANPDNYYDHHGFGMHLRNSWKLWFDNELTRDFKKRFNLFGHGDDVSGLLMHCVSREVCGLPWEDDKVADSYRHHWQNSGLDPKTGREL